MVSVSFRLGFFFRPNTARVPKYQHQVKQCKRVDGVTFSYFFSICGLWEKTCCCMTEYEAGSKSQQQSPRTESMSMESSGAGLSEQPVQNPAALGLSEALQITEEVSLNSLPPCSCTGTSWLVSHLYAQCGKWEHFKPRQHIFWTLYNSAPGTFGSWLLFSCISPPVKFHSWEIWGRV